VNRVRALGVLDQRDLVLAALFAIAAALGVAIGLHPVVRWVLVIPLVLFLPGYGLVSAVVPAQLLPAVEKVLLAIGSSIALAILTGLALACTGLGLSAVNWAFALGTLAVFSLGVAWIRRRRRGLVGPSFGLATMPRMGALMLIVALLAIVNVVLGSRLVASDQQSPPPSALWIVPLDEPAEARLGMRAGPAGGSYRIRISSSGLVLQEYALDLGPQEVWERIVEFSAEVRQRPVVARLYEGAGEAEIRFVVMQAVSGDG
jgi:hypothetical protein